jgi:hypothetical protein
LEGTKPGTGFYDKLSQAIPDINVQWLVSGKGEMFMKKPTSVQLPKESDLNEESLRAKFWMDMMENNEEYNVIPRAVLKDYKIVPDKIIDAIITSNENEKKALRESKDLEIEGLNKKYELLIEGYENKIRRLESENDQLRRQIPGQPKQ